MSSLSCFPSEILIQIFEACLQDTRAALRLVSRRFCALATPVLFRFITIRDGKEGDRVVRSADEKLTFLRRSSIVDHIRLLRIDTDSGTPTISLGRDYGKVMRILQECSGRLTGLAIQAGWLWESLGYSNSDLKYHFLFLWQLGRSLSAVRLDRLTNLVLAADCASHLFQLYDPVMHHRRRGIEGVDHALGMFRKPAAWFPALEVLGVIIHGAPAWHSNRVACVESLPEALWLLTNGCKKLKKVAIEQGGTYQGWPPQNAFAERPSWESGILRYGGDFIDPLTLVSLELSPLVRLRDAMPIVGLLRPLANLRELRLERIAIDPEQGVPSQLTNWSHVFGVLVQAKRLIRYKFLGLVNMGKPDDFGMERKAPDVEFLSDDYCEGFRHNFTFNSWFWDEVLALDELKRVILDRRAQLGLSESIDGDPIFR